MSNSLRLPGTLSLTLLDLYAGANSQKIRQKDEGQNEDSLTEDESPQ